MPLAAHRSGEFACIQGLVTVISKSQGDLTLTLAVEANTKNNTVISNNLVFLYIYLNSNTIGLYLLYLFPCPTGKTFH